MLTPFLPFLISANSLGVICFLVFAASAIVFTIPVFATRGAAQAVWFGAVGFLLTAEAAVLITLVVLQSTGDLGW